MIDHPDRQPPDLSDGAPPASRCAYSLAPLPRGDGGVSRIRTGLDRRHVLRAMAALPLVYSARIPAAADYAGARRGMLEAIARLTSLTAESTGVEAIDPAVMAAIDRVPRHEFVPEAALSSAYANRPLSIGHGQTISQPYIVALMTHLLAVEPGSRVLEIGTGSGYQAAVLAELATHVHTIEIVEPLAREAGRRLERLGYDGVRTRLGERLPRLAGRRAVRRDHRDRGCRPRAAAPGRAACSARRARHPGGRAVLGPVAACWCASGRTAR